jgi:metal-responsive CopG/Arc/MetJ family transcriptional regulator
MTTECERLTITLPTVLVEHVDRIRGDVPRSRFIRRAIEKVLETHMETPEK